MRRWFLASAAILGCSTTPEATAWPRADASMRGSNTWRGGDAAYSVKLADDRILWLFGDSFVGAGDGTDGRGGRVMVRNTVGVQARDDPSASPITFFTGEDETAFFPPEDGMGLWPGPASRIGDGVLLTFVRIRSTDAGLGFETVDSRAAWVASTEGPPTGWELEPAALPPAPPGVQLGLGAHLREGAWLYAYAPVEPGEHDIYLGRWSATAVQAGELGGMTWWTGATWSEDPAQAQPVAERLQTEFSVSRVDGSLWMVSAETFGTSNIVVRTAKHPAGPWSDTSVLYRPPRSGPGVLVYSAKVHPHLRGAPLVLTYCTNHTDFWTMASDMDLYFPRFVRVRPR